MDVGAPPPSYLMDTTPQPFYQLDTTPDPRVIEEGLLSAPQNYYIPTNRPFLDSTPYPSDEQTTFPFDIDQEGAYRFGNEIPGHIPSLFQQGGQTPPEGRVGAVKILPMNFEFLVPQLWEQLYGQAGKILNQRTMKSGNNNTIVQECNPFPFCGTDGCSGVGLSLFVAFEIFLLVLIVSANLAIISVIRDMNRNTKNRQYKSNNVFKLSLAIADLLLGLSILPGGIQSAITALINENFDAAKSQLETWDTAVSIIFGSLAVVSTIVGIWSILLIQVDLFLRIRWPVEQHSGSLMNTNRARVIVILLWCAAIGLVLALRPLGASFALSPATMTYSPVMLPTVVNGSFVSSGHKIAIYGSLVWGLPFLLTLPLGVYLVYAIAKACQRLRRRSQASYIKRHTQESISQRTRVQKDWEAACRVLVVELVYTLTFLPIIVSHFLYWKHDPCDPNGNLLHFISTFLLVAGSFLNLFVYHLMWKDFKHRLRALFCGIKAADLKSKSFPINSNTNSAISTGISTLTNKEDYSRTISISFEIPNANNKIETKKTSKVKFQADADENV